MVKIQPTNLQHSQNKIIKIIMQTTPNLSFNVTIFMNYLSVLKCLLYYNIITHHVTILYYETPHQETDININQAVIKHPKAFLTTGSSFWICNSHFMLNFILKVSVEAAQFYRFTCELK